ncbi:antitoxin [Candidatus Roizmanbacteria bacterium]|nr:antitoxin [Candidatus Roizmanbacteria bacterium]
MKKKSFRNIVLTKDEKELEESFSFDKWESIDDLATWKKELQEAAQDTLEFRKSKRITLRVNQEDLYKLKVKAIQKNIPYQTLLKVLIRDFVEGDYSVKL